MEMEVQDISGEGETTEVIIDDVIEDAAIDIEDVQQDTEDQTSELSTYKGNAYDVTSLIALISGVGILLLCLTCNLGYYLIPFLAIILGIVGVVMAQKSVNPQRTRLLSWLGIGSGAIVALIILAGIAIYIFFIILIVRSSGYSQF